jgi:hypothetical protein
MVIVIHVVRGIRKNNEQLLKQGSFDQWILISYSWFQYENVLLRRPGSTLRYSRKYIRSVGRNVTYLPVFGSMMAWFWFVRFLKFWLMTKFGMHRSPAYHFCLNIFRSFTESLNLSTVMHNHMTNSDKFTWTILAYIASLFVVGPLTFLSWLVAFAHSEGTIAESVPTPFWSFVFQFTTC